VAWDEEVNLVALDPALTAELDRHFDQDLERAERVVAGQWERRTYLQRLGEALVRPLRRWF
jgi:cardiolipin synthase